MAPCPLQPRLRKTANERRPRGSHAHRLAFVPPRSPDRSQTTPCPFRATCNPTREIVHSLRRDVSPLGYNSSIIRANRHLQHLDIAAPLRLSFNQLIQALERARLDKTHSFPFRADRILALDAHHES